MDDIAEQAAYAEPSEPASVVTATELSAEGSSESAPVEDSSEPAAKKQKLSGAQKKHLARTRDAEKRGKNHKGMNKNRHFGHVTDQVEICWRFASGDECTAGSR